MRVLDSRIGTENDIAVSINADRRTVGRRLEHLIIRRKVEPLGGIRSTLYRLVRHRRQYFFCWQCGARNDIRV